MNHFDLLETKRKHVRRYSVDKIPPIEIIEKALWKAWKTTPSKNNAMAYQVLVWGPDKILEKEAIHSLCVKNHKDAEDRAVKEGIATLTQRGANNPYYEHIKLNPYLFTIHSRVSKPNKFYREKIKEGHFFDQGYQSHIERIVDSVAVEVGIFASNLTNYLLEEDIDIAYNSCFKRRPEEWHKVGLNMIEQRPILMMTCGYAQRTKRDDLKRDKKETWDVKPEIDEIVKWI
tara:strand:+ start:716 stop:1408 length:693 start_codon:yes stop_codon:yes gene_type:complete